MGLAASQARYLSLTARKTNVEYMGQQVNQQRTLLANESANMYNELMSLEVPTAPSESDYTTTYYEFSKTSDNKYEYEFDVGSISSNSDGTYNIPITRNVEGNVANLAVAYASRVREEGEGELIKPFITLDGVEYSLENEYIPNEPEEGDVTTVTIAMLSESNSNFQPDESSKEADKTKVYYFEMDDQKYYVSEIDYKKLLTLDDGKTLSYRPSYISTGTVQQNGKITAYLTKADNGRYESITVAEDYDALGLVKGEKFDMNTESVVDERAYDDAMKDYEYKKALYDKKIEEINARTKNIQIEDRTLELKLRQLDTEQEALKTELDSVKEVIKDSCERIFKTFQSS